MSNLDKYKKQKCFICDILYEVDKINDFTEVYYKCTCNKCGIVIEYQHNIIINSLDEEEFNEERNFSAFSIHRENNPIICWSKIKGKYYTFINVFNKRIFLEDNSIEYFYKNYDKIISNLIFT